MAQFSPINIEYGFVRPEIIEGNVVLMNKTGTVNFCFARSEVEIHSDDGSLISSYKSQRGVVYAPDGAQVLPYFRYDSIWHVVMVEQFRIAVPIQTLECPGGEVDFADIQSSMAKELREETQIEIKPARIKVVFRELIQPSTMNAWAYGSIVELNQKEIPDKVIGGEWQFGEYTALVVKPLVELLKLRDSGNHNLDLWASRLLDEVAKEVGLLRKCYE